jgi:hypothetical protein
MRNVPSAADFSVAATEPSLRRRRSVVSTGLSGQGSSARCTGQVGPAVTRPSTPDGAGQGAKAVVAGPLLAGWAQGGGHDWSLGAAEGQGGGQACGPGHGGGHAWLGGTGSAVVVAGAGSAEAHGGGQEESRWQGGGHEGPELFGWAHGGGQAIIAWLVAVPLPLPPGSVGEEAHGGGQLAGAASPAVAYIGQGCGQAAAPPPAVPYPEQGGGQAVAGPAGSAACGQGGGQAVAGPAGSAACGQGAGQAVEEPAALVVCEQGGGQARPARRSEGVPASQGGGGHDAPGRAVPEQGGGHDGRSAPAAAAGVGEAGWGQGGGHARREAVEPERGQGGLATVDATEAGRRAAAAAVVVVEAMVAGGAPGVGAWSSPGSEPSRAESAPAADADGPAAIVATDRAGRDPARAPASATSASTMATAVSATSSVRGDNRRIQRRCTVLTSRLPSEGAGAPQRPDPSR